MFVEGKHFFKRVYYLQTTLSFLSLLPKELPSKQYLQNDQVQNGGLSL